MDFTNKKRIQNLLELISTTLNPFLIKYKVFASAKICLRISREIDLQLLKRKVLAQFIPLYFTLSGQCNKGMVSYKNQT